ncbi:septum formation family protein [Allokutzneria sp. A3M-2-11 16]|uniref:septum formation family protein n=1 Tax=Allokutzneria sp. A3M-2-11 16 TaxID=2962043 RepID=UPI0020B643C9|nr:septum formation family protein [Allokutzneria sp. A3M-2-11 16]MCP3799642.1 septum formation family protein [Allokutzneria sp. A3M-2-11 16]
MDHTQSTRRVMAGAFAGALLILVASTAFGWQLGSDAASSGPGHVLADAPPGTCLNWTKPDAGDVAKVPCEKPHLFELTFTADLSTDPNFGDEAAFPDELRWAQIGQSTCAEKSVEVLEGRLDPAGRLSVSALKPTQKSWENGDRKLWCGVQAAGPSGVLYPIVGSAKAIDQSDVHSVGLCVGISGRAVADPVACDKAHAYEVVGVVDLGAHFPSEYPDESKQNTLLGTQCPKLAAEYAGGPNVVEQKGLTVYWDTRKQDSWMAGSRRVDCKVGTQLQDKSGLAPISGSVSKDKPGAINISKEPALAQVPVAPPGAPAPPGSPGTDVSDQLEDVSIDQNGGGHDTGGGSTPPTSQGGG